MDIASKSLTLGRRIRNVGRAAQIAQTLARHGLWSVTDKLGIKGWLSPEQVRRAEQISREEGGVDASEVEVPASVAQSLPSRLRQIFEELGPAFVKLGQTLAVREDLLGPEYITELRKLHAEVATIPFSRIKDVLTAEFTPEVMAEFASIEEKPLAAGSIAQVHRATLKSGEEVVIKVQRPDIRGVIDSDLSLMEELAQLFEKFVPETRTTRPAVMVAELRRALEGELDFVREGGNMAKVARNFKDTPYIAIPKVHWRHTTERVLTMSYLDGIPAWDREAMLKNGLDPAILVERGFEMFLQMVFVNGLYHGDLHPGNLRALEANCVGVLDFGVTVYLARSTREHLAGLLMALVQEDFDRVVMHFLELADPPSGFDVAAFQHEIGNVIAPFIGLSLSQIRGGKLFWDLAKIAAKHGAPMPQELIVFVKTLVTFEGIGTHLDPQFDMMAICGRYTSQMFREVYTTDQLKTQAFVMARDLSNLVRQAPFQIRRILRAALEGELGFRIAAPDTARVAHALDRSSSRLSLSFLASAFLIAGSLLAFGKVGKLYHDFSILALVAFLASFGLTFLVLWSIIRGDQHGNSR